MEKIKKPLMDRIEIKDFLSQSPEEQRTLIEALQAKRSTSLALARTKLAGTKTSAKNKAKRGKKPVDQKAKLKKLIAKMTPAQLEAFKASYGI